jgi:putative MATE family efflux protein
MENNMTQGGISKALLRFAVPLILSSLFQQLYTLVDSVVVGNCVGEAALAAIGAAAPVSMIFISLITGLTMGVTILVSQYFGAGEKQRIQKAAGTFVVSLVALAVVLSALGIALVRVLLQWTHTPADILPDAQRYLWVILLGGPFLTAYNVYGSLLRGVGDSRTPLYAMILATVVNILLDLILVMALGWGVLGVAVATVAAQLLSALYLVLAVRRRFPLFRFSLRHFSFDRAIFAQGIRLGLPAAIQSSIVSVGSLLLQNVTNSFGTQTVAAITTAYRIDGIALTSVVNVGSAISTFAAQNIGAKDEHRARQGLWRGGIIILATSAAIITVIVCFGATLMRLFGVSEAVAQLGRRFLITCSVFYPIFGIQNAFSGFLQGSGDVVVPAASNIASLLLRIVLAYLLAGPVGFDTIAYAEIASWFLGLAICYIRYRSNRWRGKAVV